MPDQWPLRYRAAKRIHTLVNRLHRATGRTRLTCWLNCKTGSWWIEWWINRMVHRDG